MNRSLACVNKAGIEYKSCKNKNKWEQTSERYQIISPFLYIIEFQETNDHDVVIVSSRKKKIHPAEQRIGQSPEREIGSKLLQSLHQISVKVSPAAALLHGSTSPHNQKSHNERPTGSLFLIQSFKMLPFGMPFSRTVTTQNSSRTLQSHLISHGCC